MREQIDTVKLAKNYIENHPEICEEENHVSAGFGTVTGIEIWTLCNSKV
jgi:hypothetical protein